MEGMILHPNIPTIHLQSPNDMTEAGDESRLPRTIYEIICDWLEDAV